MGQLLVWEWQSESYVFKQQGHFNNMASLAYSPDGQHIVTGGDDGKVSVLRTGPSALQTCPEIQIGCKITQTARLGQCRFRKVAVNPYWLMLESPSNGILAT